MKNKIIFLTILVAFVLIIPNYIFADGGMIVWPPKVHLDQTAQNAIVAWNGEEEIIILSNDIESDTEVIALRMVPLPSNPSEIKEGSFESFDKITEIMNEKIEKIQTPGFGREGDNKTAGVEIEITFHEQIGAHDVTVVKVNDLDYFLEWIENFAEKKGFSMTYEINCEDYTFSTCPDSCKRVCIASYCSPEGICTTDCADKPGSCVGDKISTYKISSEFKNGISNYLKRDIKYFVFDVINTKETKESIQPLIYKFDSDYLYYPLKVTAISEIKDSYGKIQVFFIAKDFIPEKHQSEFPVEFSQEEIKEVSEEIADLFESSVEVLSVNFYGRLHQFNEDLILFPSGLWKRDLSIGSSGEDVKMLQKFLINIELWDSETEATGFFGPITKNALAKFQEEQKYKILRPIGLEKGTGYFGEKTRICFDDFFIKIDIDTKVIVKWVRNLSLGMKGDDVKSLQEVLIAEGVWQRSDVEATGYFGSITQQAVIRFQEKYSSEILEPVGLIKGTGFVGSSTRAYLENIEK
ncbi:DUF2330 domain-containing protein [Candidatus Parcubacteria bacterium]|nr:DUF2330 domain-containing protein [Candidatus Parcubacteria bacterium]